MVFGVLENPNESLVASVISAVTVSIPWAILLFRRDNRIDLRLVVEEQGKYISTLKSDIEDQRDKLESIDKKLRRSERREELCREEIAQLKAVVKDKHGIELPTPRISRRKHAVTGEDDSPTPQSKDTDDALPEMPRDEGGGDG